MRTSLASILAIGLVVAIAGAAQPARAGSPNGSASDMPAYYDGKLFTINFKELPAGGETSNLAHNRSINQIYMSDAGLPGGLPFVSVLDAIQGDGFNPLWQEVQVNFVTGHTPVQLTSDTDVEAAEAAGIVTLTPTGELYRCSVVGSKKGSAAAATAAAPTFGARRAAPSARAGAPASWGVLRQTYLK